MWNQCLNLKKAIKKSLKYPFWCETLWHGIYKHKIELKKVFSDEEMFEEGEESDKNEIFLTDEQDTNYFEIEIEEFFEQMLRKLQFLLKKWPILVIFWSTTIFGLKHKGEQEENFFKFGGRFPRSFPIIATLIVTFYNSCNTFYSFFK